MHTFVLGRIQENIKFGTLQAIVKKLWYKVIILYTTTFES